MNKKMELKDIYHHSKIAENVTTKLKTEEIISLNEIIISTPPATATTATTSNVVDKDNIITTEEENIIFELPRAILLRIIQYLSGRGLSIAIVVKLSHVNKNFYDIINDQKSKMWDTLDFSIDFKSLNDRKLYHLLQPSEKRFYSIQNLSLMKCRNIHGVTLSKLLLSDGNHQNLKLKEIDLSFCISFSLENLFPVLRECKCSIESLNLKGVKGITDKSLMKMFEMLQIDSGRCGLKSLKLGYLSKGNFKSIQFTDKALSLIASYCPELKVLSIHNQNRITDTGILALAQSKISLIELDLSLCCNITDFTIESIAHGFPHIKILDVRQCWRLAGHSFKTLFVNAPNLKSLFLSSCLRMLPVTFQMNNNIMNSLVELHINKIPCISDREIQELAVQATNLQFLSLSLCNKVTNYGILQLFEHNGNMKSLNISDCSNITAQWIHDLANMKLPNLPLENLINLNMRRTNGWTDTTIRLLLSSDLHAGCGATNLKFLLIGGIQIYQQPKLLYSANDSELQVAGLEEDLSIIQIDNDNENENEGMDDGMGTGAEEDGIGAGEEAHNYVKKKEQLKTKQQNQQQIPFGIQDYGMNLIGITIGATLETLDIEGMESITNDGINALISHCKLLRKLNLDGIPSITDQTVCNLAERLFHLDDLSVNYCPNVSSRVTYSLKRLRPNFSRFSNKTLVK